MLGLFTFLSLSLKELKYITDMLSFTEVSSFKMPYDLQITQQSGCDSVQTGLAAVFLPMDIQGGISKTVSDYQEVVRFCKQVP